MINRACAVERGNVHLSDLLARDVPLPLLRDAPLSDASLSNAPSSNAPLGDAPLSNAPSIDAPYSDLSKMMTQAQAEIDDCTLDAQVRTAENDSN